MQGEVPICYDCKHKRELLTCDAFPDAIPIEIIMGIHDHHEAFSNDKGIQFEPEE